METFIPLSVPNFEGNEQKYVDDAVREGWVSTGGAYINKLEESLENYLKTDRVAACQSGTAAIHLALIEAGVGSDDMVIVPTLTFIAAVNPVRYQNAEPVFMDCDESLCMNPVKLAEFCENECEFAEGKLIHKTRHKPVKAIIVVHVFGNMADMEAIMEIAEKYNISVIEDATEALGSRFTGGKYSGKYAGTIGDFGTFSFNGNKIITTGGGGAITSRHSSKVEHIKYLSTQAKNDAQFYIHDEIGYNYRMTNVQAAIGVAQMEKLPEFIERKHRNYDEYMKLFGRNKVFRLMPFRENTFSNQWFYSLEIDMDKAGMSMREIIDKLQRNGIQTRMIWGLIHEQKPYADCLVYKIDKAVYYSRCILNIPCSTNLKSEEIEYTAKMIINVLGE